LKKNTAQLVTLFALSQLVDGARQTDGREGMSAPENRAMDDHRKAHYGEERDTMRSRLQALLEEHYRR
jgi:hypothetical protein